MKALNFFIALICLSTHNIYLHAQDVKVRVVSGTEQLPYAFLYVNGEPAGAADSTGLFAIPQSKLNNGDTISASFVGFEGGQTIYDGKTGSERIIDLKALYEIDSLVVQVPRFNMWKFFRQNVNIPNFAYGNKQFSFDFDSEVTDSNGEHRSSGNITIIPYPRLDFHFLYKRPSLETKGDTTNIKITEQSMVFALWLGMGSSVMDTYKRAHITSRGIVNGDRVFILSYPLGFHTFQILLRVDQDTKNIKSEEASYLRYSSLFLHNISFDTGKNKMLTITGYDYEVYTPDVTGKIKVSNIKESEYKNAFALFQNDSLNKPN